MELNDQKIENRDFTVEEFSFKEVCDCIFINCNFQDVDLKNVRFLDCEFTACNMSIVNFSFATIRGCRFADCKCFGTNWSVTNRLEENTFDKCQMTSSIFMNEDLRGFSFNESNLRDVDFSECDMRKVSFNGSDLSGAVFRDTNLMAADFSTAHSYEIDPTFNKIKNAKFSLPDATSLLKGLGIKLV